VRAHRACVQATLHGHAAKRLRRAHGHGGAGPRGLTSLPRRHLPALPARLCCRMCTGSCVSAIVPASHTRLLSTCCGAAFALRALRAV
jgi:hypothetical protein